jgi:hypothetical protein
MSSISSFRRRSRRAIQLAAGVAAAVLALTGAVATPAQAASSACSPWTMLQYAPNIYGMACVSSPNGANTEVSGLLYNGGTSLVVADIYAYVGAESDIRFVCSTGPGGVLPGRYVSCPSAGAFWTPPPRYARAEFVVNYNFAGTLYSPWLS